MGIFPALRLHWVVMSIITAYCNRIRQKKSISKKKKKTLKKSTWLFQQLANLLEPFYEELEIFMFLKNIQK